MTVNEQELALMSPASPPSSPPWPRWLVALASVPLVYHLGSIGVGALAAGSGPWPTGDGVAMAVPPPAAAAIHESAALPYLRAIGLTHNYHFPSNRVGGPDAYLEVRLEDDAGQFLKTVRVPDPDAPPMVRQRQAQLIRWLIDDQPVAPPRNEVIYPPGQLPPRVTIWEVEEGRGLVLAEISEVEVPRNRPVFRPTPWSLVVVRAIARHECRTHGAAHARVVRHSRSPVSPEVLLMPQAVPAAIDELVSDYGRFSR
jgi:hypothetical protein